MEEDRVEKEDEDVGLADDKSYISFDEGLLRVSYAIESTIRNNEQWYEFDKCVEFVFSVQAFRMHYIESFQLHVRKAAQICRDGIPDFAVLDKEKKEEISVSQR